VCLTLNFRHCRYIFSKYSHSTRARPDIYSLYAMSSLLGCSLRFASHLSLSTGEMVVFSAGFVRNFHFASKPLSIMECCKCLEGVLYQDWMGLASSAEIL